LKTYKAKGIVCSNTKLGEADKIISVYTDLGLIRAVAKGARKTKSKFGGRLEPLSFVDLVLYKGKNLDTVTQVELVRPFNKIRTNLQLLSVALTMTGFIEKSAEHESHPGELVEIILKSIERIESGFPPELSLVVFMAAALSRLGYIFNLDCCVRCSGRLKSVSVFGIDSGGFLCGNCSNLDQWMIELNKESGRLLTELINGSFGDINADNYSAQSIKQISKVFEAFIKYHLDINLKSFRFLTKL
jgi:DNA repair protein RecO (recombination protein O)